MAVIFVDRGFGSDFLFQFRVSFAAAIFPHDLEYVFPNGVGRVSGSSRTD